MKRFLILLFMLIAVAGYSQREGENYKLGNFYKSGVKARSVIVGGSWTIKKNSTSTALDIYYGDEVIGYFTTTGGLVIDGALTSTGASSSTTSSVDTLYLGTLQHMLQKVGNSNAIKTEGSVAITDTLFIGTLQHLLQEVGNSNTIKAEGSLEATDTLFGAVLSTTGNIQGLGTANHISGAGAGAASGMVSLSTNGTPQLMLNDLDAPASHNPMWYLQSASNGSKGVFYLGYGNRSSGTTMYGYTDVMVMDSISMTLGTAIGTGTGFFYSGKVNTGQGNYELYAMDQNVQTTSDVQFAAITGSTLPTFTIAAGTVTPVLPDDTIGFAVAGLTTGAIVLVSPATSLATTDTVPWVHTVRTGWLTLGGKNAAAINYWIPKK